MCMLLYLFHSVFYHSLGDGGLPLAKRESLEAFVHARLFG